MRQIVYQHGHLGAADIGVIGLPYLQMPAGELKLDVYAVGP